MKLTGSIWINLKCSSNKLEKKWSLENQTKILVAVWEDAGAVAEEDTEAGANQIEEGGGGDEEGNMEEGSTAGAEKGGGGGGEALVERGFDGAGAQPETGKLESQEKREDENLVEKSRNLLLID